MPMETGHVALGLLLMAFLFLPLAIIIGGTLRVLERLGALSLAVPAWRLAFPAALWIGWLAQSLYWLGRERAQHEHRAGLDPHLDWWAGWNVLDWPLDARLDFALPALVNALVALGLCAVLALREQRREALRPVADGRLSGGAGEQPAV